MKKLNLITLSLAMLSGTAFANSTQIYIEQNVASDAADNGTYSTEVGALIDTSDDGQVYIGFDDQGWLGVGYGHDFQLSDSVNFNLYGEIGKWETGEEILVDAIFDYRLTDDFNLFGGLGYSQSGNVPENLSDTDINTYKIIAGAQYSIGSWDLSYQYTHENRDGSNGSVSGSEFSQDSYRTNEHEIVLSTTIDDWTPYIKYTHLNSNETEPVGIPSSIVDKDNIVTLGLSYDF
jgi:hypothetical protein